ncbi:MAG: hypothetical protein R2856_26355 [Caldilineaceae bacterium]
MPRSYKPRRQLALFLALGSLALLASGCTALGPIAAASAASGFSAAPAAQAPQQHRRIHCCR